MVEFVFSPNTSIVFLISQIIVIIFALFLMGLAIKAWKNTRLNKIIYVVIAFALFAVIHTLNYVDQSVVSFVSDDIRHAIFAVIEIGIMMMFVVAIIKK